MPRHHSPLAHTVVDGPESTRIAWILHGILGSGRNWRGFARRLRRRDPRWAYVLPDLRNHGRTGPRPGPHGLDAVTADLRASLPPPERVIGHSFGGKVALQWAREGGEAADVWVLDSLVDASDPGDEHQVMAVMEAIRSVPTPAPERALVRRQLLECGLSGPLVSWLLTSMVHGPEGWRWVYDLQAIEQMMEAYFEADFSPWLAAHDAPPTIHLVCALRNPRWTSTRLAALERHRGPEVRIHTLPHAGHWLHVDDPAGLAALLVPTPHGGSGR